MQVEFGTFWVWERGDPLPPLNQAQVDNQETVVFKEVTETDIDALTIAMSLSTPDPIRQRLRKNRRCFILKIDDQIASYGWVTQGIEQVGELERSFHFHDNEVYIWDCATIPVWRGKRCYSTLLSHLIHQFHNEGISRIWIGASRQNQPSVRGISNAGFQQVMDLDYRRLNRMTILWLQKAPQAAASLVSAAYRILVDDHEYRLGPLAFGFR